MEQAKSLGTITGSLVRPTSQPNCDPSENERKLAALLKLGSHYWTPDFTPAQAKHLLADYLDDLSAFRFDELDIACRDWRRSQKNKRFPRSAELAASIREYRRCRQETNSGRKAIQGGPDGKPWPDRQSRPYSWWCLPRAVWKPEWREQDAPDGSMVYDQETGERRKAYRFG